MPEEFSLGSIGWRQKPEVAEVAEEPLATKKLFTIPEEHIVYRVREDEKQFVVLDGVEQKKYDLVRNLSFTPDSQFIVYNAKDGRDLWIIVEEIK